MVFHDRRTFEGKTAFDYLARVARLVGRTDEWQRILDGIRTEYKRRSSLVAILNEIDQEQGGMGRISDLAMALTDDPKFPLAQRSDI